MLDRADQQSLHRFASCNRQLLEAASRAGCFHCGAIFPPSEIKDWVDGRHVETGSLDDGVTALCPRCGIDAVIPETRSIAITPELLAEMTEFWFK